MKHKLSILGSIMLLLIACRIWLDGSQNELPAVAGINLISLIIVFLSMAEQIKDKITEKIRQTKVPEERIQAEVDIACKHIPYLCLLPVVFAVLYYRYWICPPGNDIIAIVALFLSLLEEEVADIAVYFYEGFLWKK